jgi:hypothetical protein
MCEDVSDRAWHNVQWKERKRNIRKNEDVSKRRGELNNSKLFLHG